MDRRQEITDLAGGLDHGYIILDELQDDGNPDYELFRFVIEKIREIENNYTDEEIEEGNLLCDLW